MATVVLTKTSCQNPLAKSLNPRCYVHNPGLIAFLERTGLPCEPVEHFDKAALEQRQRPYQLLAEHMWNPGQLQAVLAE